MSTPLIDRLLDLRNTPTSTLLLGDLQRGKGYTDTGEPALCSPAWQAHYDAVDAAIDLILPVLRAINDAPVLTSHGLKCVDKEALIEIVGRPPSPQSWLRRRVERGSE